MTLTRFFYINNDDTKIFYNYFCNYPKKTKVYRHLLRKLKCDKSIKGIGYTINTTNGNPITYNKLK